MIDYEAQSRKLFELYERHTGTARDFAEAETEDESLEAVYAASQWQLMWRKFIRNKVAIIGGIIILVYYLSALFAGFVAPYTLSTRFIKYIYMPPQRVHLFHDGKFQPYVYDVDLEVDENLRKIYTPNPDVIIPIQFFARGEPYKLFGLIETDVHLFQTPEGIVSLLGTDRQGRDMFSRVLYGSQVSLTIGLLGVLLSLSFGSVLGIASGYYGGWIDELIQRLIELVRSFPAIPLWMALSAAVPPHWPPLRTYFVVTLILSLIGWTWLARQLRGKVLTLRNEEFILAAKLSGASDARIIFRHLVPATFSHIIVVSTLAMPAMILAETALSFLGLGLRPPITSWGVLLKEVQNLQSIALYPWVFTPALAIAIAILAFNFLGDGLRDAADPYTV
jgi:peptide/nickel transport system permease protein